MKSKYVLLASTFVLSLSTYAQKDQIKAAEKALKNGNSAEAMTSLSQAEPLLEAATPAEKAQYYFVKGNAALDLAHKNGESLENLTMAANSYKQVLEIEKESGKAKYSEQATAALANVKSGMINVAVESGNQKKYKEGAQFLFAAYEIDKTDVEKLYYAASYAVNAQDYDTALAYYNELKRLNYSGEGMAYYAKNVLNEQEEFFASKEDRDSKVKLKLYTDPREEVIPSKRGEIYKNIALILLQKNQTEEAKTALSEARVANPDDTSLTLAEADIYLKLQDFVTYKKLISEVLAKNPNDADLVYNLGVISAKNDPVAAEQYYKRAIEIKPDYINAYLNLAILILDGEKKLVDDMNKLGTSEKDMKKYDVLKKQRDGLFLSSIPYLEKAYELNPANEDVATTLLNVYSALEMMDKKKALKAKMGKK
jgi:tetratricopeptide (TPR) repeat protein